MPLPTISVLNGATLDFEFDDTTDAETVSIIVKGNVSDASPQLYETATFTEGVANMSFPVDIPAGTYIYQFTVIYTGGEVKKYPSGADCDGECEFPSFIVCSSLDPGVS